MNADLAKHIYASQKVSKGLAHVKKHVSQNQAQLWESETSLVELRIIYQSIHMHNKNKHKDVISIKCNEQSLLGMITVRG
jgi:hypothetical protein